MDERRLVLVDFLAAEHRLRRQAVRESQEVELWERRVAFALERNLTDMAAEARIRADRHARMHQVLLDRAEEIRTEIASMREVLHTTRGAGRAPPLAGAPPYIGPPRLIADDFDSRFAKLEIEQEIEAIRAAVLARSRGEQGANERSTQDV
jgi:hypothetical protein